jgi:hypothetical protein
LLRGKQCVATLNRFARIPNDYQEAPVKVT